MALDYRVTHQNWTLLNVVNYTKEVLKMSRNKTNDYSESYRKEAVRLADLPENTAIGVADDLGINVGQIYNWRNQFKRLTEKQFNTLEGVDYSKDESAEMRALRKENKMLREERDFLKKATAYFVPGTTSEVRRNRVLSAPT